MDPTEKVTCRKCKSEIQAGSRFCHMCGAKQEITKPRKTRGNGQGTAIKRGNTWTAIWTTGYYVEATEGGETPRRVLHQKRKWKGGFKTKTAALAYAANPEPEREKCPTLRSYYNGWEAADYQDLSKSKQTAFRIAWGKLEAIADRAMDAITITDLQSAVDGKAQTYYPAKDMKTLLSHLFKRAVAEGHARTNLADFIRLPSLDEKEMQPFAETELKKLWDAYGAGDHVVGFILLMVYSGMMPGELLTLKGDMVDFEKCEIVGCGLKTKKRKVTPIVFPDMVAPVVHDLISRSKSAQGYVVGMNKDHFYKEYHAALQRAGVRDLPPYSCRHTTATALALGNIAPSVIQEVMRHTKFSTTQRYIHPDSEAARKAVNSLDKC